MGQRRGRTGQRRRGPSDRSRAAAVLAGPVLAAAVLAGCAHAPAPGPAPAPAARSTVTPTAQGPRTALVHVPAGVGPGAPLVVVLHGLGGSGAAALGSLGWAALADREGFVVAHPDGLDGSWNAGRCCGTSWDRGVDDVAYLDALVAQIAAEHGTDPRRVHAVGFSNGAMMSYAWACARPGRLAGIGPVGGALVADCPGPGPVTVVALHGEADRSVPLGGGRGPRSATGHDYPGLDESLAPFVAAGVCGPPRVEGAAPGFADRLCREGHHVVRGVLAGGGHEWPRRPDATALLWRHLEPAPAAG